MFVTAGTDGPPAGRGLPGFVLQPNLTLADSASSFIRLPVAAVWLNELSSTGNPAPGEQPPIRGPLAERMIPLSASFITQSSAVPLRPLAETAALFRQECHALDHLVEELYRDVEQLRDELVRKSEEIDDGRKKLAERGRQLAEQRKESGRLVHLLEQQETRLTEALVEVKKLRDQTGRDADDAREREAARQEFLEQTVRAAEAERDQLRHELNVLQATVAAAGGNAAAAETLTPLMGELGDMRRQLSETQTQVDEARRQLTTAIKQSTAAIEQIAVRGESDAAEVVQTIVPTLLEELTALRQQVTAQGNEAAAARQAAPAEPLQSVAPALFAELAEMRRLLDATQSELGETRAQLGQAHAQLAAGLDRAAAARDAEAAPQAEPRVLEILENLERQVTSAASQNDAGAAPDGQTQERLAALERERVELEAELELVRTRATELQEVVTQQRRELVEQRADITTELRLLRELVEQNKHVRNEEPAEEEPVLVGATSRGGETLASAPDPVVSSVMAQFARLQKDVAQRRKKK